MDRKQLKTQLSFFFLLNWRTFEWTYESDCLRWCLWWACIESRLAERITGMQLGWLVRRQLLFGVRTQRESGMVKVSDPKIFFCTPDSYPSLICRPTYTDSAIMESDLKITNIINNFWDFCRHSLLSNAVNFWNMQSLTAEALGFLGGLISVVSGKLVEDRRSQCVAACLSFFLFACLCQFVCQRILGSQKWWPTAVVCQFAIQGKLVADSRRHWVACLDCLSLRLLLTFLNFLLWTRESTRTFDKSER